MKLTKETLKRIIKEELNGLMNEDMMDRAANQRGENHMMVVGEESATLYSKHLNKPYTVKKGQQPYWGMIQKAAAGDEFSIQALRKDAGITDDLPLVFGEL